VKVLAGVTLAFLGGPVIGLLLARAVAPDSFVAEAVGAFMLPLAFAGGMQLWLGAAIATAVVQLVRRVASGGPWRPSSEALVDVPPGAFAFVPVSTGAGMAGGLMVGFVSSSLPFLVCWQLYAAVGAAYGVAVWQLARAGYLPFPEQGL
jgi:hypothetical protein